MDKDKRPLLVLGGSGQVGGAVIKEAKRRNITFVGTYYKHSVPELIHWNGDVADIRGLIDESKPRAVVYAAGMTNVDACERHKEKVNRWNAEVPSEIAKLCRGLCSFVYFSTDYVFDGKKGPYSEEEPVSPPSAYGCSKAKGEEGVLSAHSTHLVIRTTVVYGPEAQEKNFVARLCNKLALGEPIRVASDQIGSPTYNEDLAKRALDLLELKKDGIWHVAGPELIDRASFAMLVAEIFNLDKSLIRPVLTKELNQAAKRPLNAGLKIEKLNSTFGSSCMRSPKEGLLTYASWEAEVAQ